jgi:integrase/recombinase XerD
MNANHVWNVDSYSILTRRELGAVLADLEVKAKRSASAQMNRVIFRLACCCGLRASEIAQLHASDVCETTERPHIRLRPGVAKGGRPRRVPLWWDEGTLADLTEWKAGREGWFVGCQKRGREGAPLTRHTIRRRFLTACKCLGTERLSRLTIHHGRHTFISHALAGGRTLAEVRDAAGHANIATTSIYLHVVVDDEGVGRLFEG